MKPGLRYHLPDVPPLKQQAGILRQFHEYVAARRLLDLRGAELFNVISRLGIHLHEGFSSVADMAEARGMSAYGAREIQNLGTALYHYPEILPDIETGRIPVANGDVLGRLYPDEEVLPGDTWVEWARTERPRDFLRRFQERRDQVRRGRPVIALVAHVSYRGLRDFERARKLASRSAQKVLTAGETIEVVVDEYLEKHDPLLKPGAARRQPDTDTPVAAASGSRYISAAVRQAVRARKWDKCAVDFCSRDTFLTFSHRKPHREHGSREAENLDLLCGWHHMLYEQGVIVIEGTADAPVFKTVEGRVIGENDCDADFLNASAARDAAASMEQWKKKDAEAAARAKEEGVRAPQFDRAPKADRARKGDASHASPTSGAPPDSDGSPPAVGPPTCEPLPEEPDPFGYDAAARRRKKRLESARTQPPDPEPPTPAEDVQIQF